MELRGQERTGAPVARPGVVHDAGGTGPGVLLLHGMTRTLADWYPVLRLLPEPLRPVAVDFPGHGASGGGADWHWRTQLQVVDELIEGLGLGPTVLVGHSLGGMIATAAAVSSDRLLGAVNVDGHGVGTAAQFAALDEATVTEGMALMQRLSPASFAEQEDVLAAEAAEREIEQMTT